MEFKILDNQGKLSKKTLTASDATFAIDFNEALIHKLVVSYMSNARSGQDHKKQEVRLSTALESLLDKKVLVMQELG